MAVCVGIFLLWVADLSSVLREGINHLLATLAYGRSCQGSIGPPVSTLAFFLSRPLVFSASELETIWHLG